MTRDEFYEYARKRGAPEWFIEGAIKNMEEMNKKGYNYSYENIHVPERPPESGDDERADKFRWGAYDAYILLPSKNHSDVK